MNITFSTAFSLSLYWSLRKEKRGVLQHTLKVNKPALSETLGVRESQTEPPSQKKPAHLYHKTTTEHPCGSWLQ